MAEPAFAALLREALGVERLAQSKWRVVAAAIFKFYGNFAAFMNDVARVRKIIVDDLPQESRDSLLDDTSLRGRVLDASDIEARQILRVKTQRYIWTTLDRIKTYTFPEEYAAEKKREAARKDIAKALQRAAASRRAARTAMVRGVRRLLKSR